MPPRQNAAARRAAANAAADTAPARPAAPAVLGTSRSGDTVTVACKLSVARFELQISEMRDVQENTQTGPRTVRQGFKTGEVHVVRGTAYPEGTPPKGFIKRPLEVEGYALTRGIPKEFWDIWLEQNKRSVMVQNRLIFASPTMDEVEGRSAENCDVKCALSPLDMPMRDGEKIDTRVPRSALAGVGDIERLTV